MRSTATLQKNTPANNSSGGKVDVWSNVCTFRCRIEQKSSRRTVEQMQPMNDKSFQLTCRAQRAITDSIGYDSRIMISGVAYAVKAYYLEKLNNAHWYTMTIAKNG